MRFDGVRLDGIPFVYNRWVRRGEAYFANGILIIGTWWRKPSVSSVIASQRRRRQ